MKAFQGMFDGLEGPSYDPISSFETETSGNRQALECLAPTEVYPLLMADVFCVQGLYFQRRPVVS